MSIQINVRPSATRVQASATVQRQMAQHGGRYGTNATPVVASDLRFGNSNLRAIGANGELNADNKRDLMRQQAQLINACASGNVITEEEALSIQQEHRYMVQASFSDAHVHRVTGEALASALYMTGTRQGFSRRFTARVDVQQGSEIRFQVRGKNVTAVTATSPTKIVTQKTQDKWLRPFEFTITTRPFITMNELNVSPADLLEEKFVEAQEATMVSEDRLYYRMLQDTIGDANPLTTVTGNLTPYAVAQVANMVARYGMKPAHLLMATDLYQDIIGGSEFYTAMEPVARHQLLMTGEIGTMYGMAVTTDAYRHQEHKVLGKGEFYVISDKITHGAHADRGGIISSPIDISTEGYAGKGWVLTEAFAVAVANTRSVGAGKRL